MSGPADLEQLGVVIIGRDEAKRLGACIRSVLSELGDEARARTVYVDSGSKDASVRIAEQFGVRVLRLDPALPFSAARGRNEGFSLLRALHTDLRYVQFIDGDCTLARGWCRTALQFLTGRDDLAMVCGRLRECYSDLSIYNQMCDIEWDAPTGEATACGGIVLVSALPFADVHGFDTRLAAGEEPELCIRLRERGWIIWRLPAEMALHDADMTHFSQWWRRMVRNGEAFAHVWLLHGRSPYGIWRREMARAVIWGGLLPLVACVGAFVLGPAALLLLLAYPLQVIRIAWHRGLGEALSWRYATLMTIGKLAEFLGIVRFLLDRLRSSTPRRSSIP